MATVIDSLVVELGLDPKKFSAGAKQAVTDLRSLEDESRRRGRGIETSASNATATFSQLQRQVLNTFAIMAGGVGVKEMITQTITADSSLARMSRTLGVSGERVSVWQRAMRAAGGTTEEAKATIGGLISEAARFNLTGESSMIPAFRAMGIDIADANGKMKDFEEILISMARWADRSGGTSADKSALLAMTGVSPGAINMLLQGEAAVRRMLRAQEESAGANKASEDAAERLTKKFSDFTSAVEGLGRALMVLSEGPIAKFLTSWSGILNTWASGKFAASGTTADHAKQMFGKIFQTLSGKATSTTWSQWDDPVNESEGLNTGARGGGGAFKSQAEKEAFIRAEARKRGIDPETAMRVARSEGFDSFQSSIRTKDGSREKSWGAFQLYTGGGLGNVFQKQTGLDPSDPNNERATIQFALDKAAKGGWSPWHGAARVGVSPFQGLPGPRGAMAGGGGSSTSSTNIGSIVINTAATDAAGIAAEIKPAIERQSMTYQADTGIN